MVNIKGQMSLEMVIGLVILLVVAGVVISLLLQQFSDPGPDIENPMEIREFLAECERLCEDKDIEYCNYYYEGNDWDNNGIGNELIKIGDQKWDVCEDRVYCFFVQPCKKRFGDQPIKGCAQALCNNYKQKYNGNLTLASIAVLRDIVSTTDPECKSALNKIPHYDNWKISFFNTTYGNQSLCEYYLKQ
jgi:hypothetical protein